MGKCSVCGKDTQGEATECSASCMLSASGKTQRMAAKARMNFDESVRRMMEPTKQDQVETPKTPTFRVKHRSYRNKSLTCRNLLIAFDADGIAHIDDLGDNRSIAAEACKFSRGAMKILPKESPVKPFVDDLDRQVAEAVEKAKSAQPSVTEVVAETPKEVVPEPVMEELVVEPTPAVLADDEEPMPEAVEGPVVEEAKEAEETQDLGVESFEEEQTPLDVPAKPKRKTGKKKRKAPGKKSASDSK